MSERNYPAHFSTQEVEVCEKVHIGTTVDILNLGNAKVQAYNDIIGCFDVLFEDGKAMPIMPIQIQNIVANKTIEEPKAPSVSNEKEHDKDPKKDAQERVMKAPSAGQIKMIGSEMLRIGPADGDWQAWMQVTQNILHKLTSSWEASTFIDWLLKVKNPLMVNQLLAHRKLKAMAWHRLQDQGKSALEASELLKGDLTRSEVLALIGEINETPAKLAG